MGFTSAGLTNGGRTLHYQFQYDESLAGPGGIEPNRTNQVIAACEGDYNLISSWFGGDLGITGMTVQVTTIGGGAEWNGDPFHIATIKLKPAGGSYSNSPVYLRYLLVAEVTEVFMMVQNAGWFVEGHNEGSMGEGLSRFLSAQFLRGYASAALASSIEPPYAVTDMWLNGTRPNFVDSDPDDNHPDQVTGCTTCFIYYLYSQLGFSINEIIAAGASNMAGVYQNLTGRTDAWTVFINLVNTHYPPLVTYNLAGDDIFPVSDLSDFWPPNRITTGYDDVAQLFLDNPAAAGPLTIYLTSETLSVVTVPLTVTLLMGSRSTTVPIHAVPIAGPFAPRSVNVHASYAGRTVTIRVEVVPPAVTQLTLSPDTVVCGNQSQGTVTLNRPSLLGAVVVNLISGAPGYANVPAQITVAQGQTTSSNFVITTPNIRIPFSPAHSDISASYGPSSCYATLHVNPRVTAGILKSLTLFPTSLTAGGSSRGTVTLERKVPTDTLVGLAALADGALPWSGNSSAVASVPASITIPAGRTTGSFTITTKRLSPRQTRTATIMASAVTTKYAMLRVSG